MSDKSKAHAAALRQQRRRSKPGPMLWVVLALMGVAVVVMIASLSTQTGMGATPEFTATTLSGDTIQLSGYRGQVVMLNFWATWCPPCIAELPLLNTFFHEQQAAGWQVLGLAVDQIPAVRGFLEKRPVDFPIAMAGAGGTELTRSLGNLAGGLPFTVVFAADGRVLHRKMGQIKPQDLVDWAAKSAAAQRS